MLDATFSRKQVASSLLNGYNKRSLGATWEMSVNTNCYGSALRASYRSVIALILGLGGTISGLPAAAQDHESFGVSEILLLVKKEIVAAQQEQTGQPRLRIDEVILDLAVTTDSSSQAGISFSVPIFESLEVAASANSKDTRSSRLRVTFLPEANIFVSSHEDLGLAKAIKEVKKAIQETINEPPKLLLKSFAYETSFVTIRGAGGKISLWIIDLSPLNRQYSATNTIKVKISIASDD